MSLDYLFPITESHAIQSVIFVLEWQGEISDRALQEVQSLGQSLKSHFPISTVQKVVMVNLDQATSGSPAIQQNGDAMGGVVFQRMGKFGQVASQMVVSRNNCLIAINEYSRWDAILEAVMRYYKIVLPPILREKSIGSIALQYNDMFTWKDEPANLNLREVFKTDTPYLAPNSFEQKGLWHCHHGFIRDLEGVDGTCLDNINVSVVNNQDDRAIQILTSHKLTLNSPLRIATKDYLQSIEKYQNILHQENKLVLGQLLSEEVCEKIKLKNQADTQN
ncbi:TIGR04255 family protein [Noviherbaspirillum saxi]|uniref:TIGR04255 family protein n=1 Tax=Noviherbaspirillum saxi TaxID=2320863 RepID=A0A3A3FUM1_9BURK|nr:TIGR04255 family protein [Noviherbaspirillum saxi]RJF98994.1 TIGR04255 family protein [Noviherbaspirillum saxi]